MAEREVINLEKLGSSTAPSKENWGWSGESPLTKSLHYFLSKETFSMAVKVFRICSLVKCVPFELEFKNKGSLRVRPFEKKWQWALWHLVTWMIFALIAFQWISFGFLWQRMSFGKEMAFHIMYLVFSGWMLILFLSVYSKPMACLVLLNHHDEIMRNLSRLGLNRTRKQWTSHPFVILIVYYMAWTLILFDFVFVLFYLRHPERSQYIYSAFPSSWKNDSMILYGGCALFEFFWFCCSCSLLCLFCSFWCASIYTINNSLNELRTSKIIKESTIESFLFYQLFCISFNDFNAGIYSVGLCFLQFVSPVIFIYLSLTTFHMLSIVVYLAFPTFALVTVGCIVLFFPQSSKVQIKSRDALKRFSHLPIGSKRVPLGLVNLSHLTEGERRGYLKRRVKAFRHLRIQISSFGAFSLTTSAVLLSEIFTTVILLFSL